MRIILSILFNGLLIWLGAQLLSGVYVDGYLTAIIAGLILGLVNFFVKPLVTFLTFPITLLTMGLFLLVINAGMILLVDELVEGFRVDGWIWAMMFSILLALSNLILGQSSPNKRRK